MEQDGSSPFAIALDDLSAPAARFGELLCAPRAALNADTDIHGGHFAHMALLDFASAVTYSESDTLHANVQGAVAHNALRTTGRRSHPAPRMADSRKLEAPTKRARFSAKYNVKRTVAATPKNETCLQDNVAEERTDVTHQPVADEKRRAQHREAVKSHTRKCREKVNENFERLLQALPTPPCGVEVKHKAQVLEYTIRVFRQLIARRHALRTDIALSSAQAVAQWADGEFMSRHFEDVVENFTRLYATKKNWKYAEVWMEGPRRTSTILNGDHELLTTFSKAHIPSDGMVMRAFAARQAEWLPDVGSDSTASARANVAKQCGLRVALTVPVVIRDGTCMAVLLFADTLERAFSTLEVAEVVDFARVIAEAYMQHRGLRRKHGQELKEENEQVVDGSFDAGSAFSLSSTHDGTPIADLFPTGGVFPSTDVCAMQYVNDRR